MLGVLICDKQLHAYLEIDKLKKIFKDDNDEIIANLIVQYKGMAAGVGDPLVDKQREKIRKQILKRGGYVA
jgi:hypothetical protein